jgi:hypothetical protein
MAWRCSGSSNAGLVANLWTHGLISDPLVKEAFLKASCDFNLLTVAALSLRLSSSRERM